MNTNALYRRPAFLLPTVVLALGILTAPHIAWSQTDSPSVTIQPEKPKPDLPPYQIPKIGEITETLLRVRAQCDRFSYPKVYHRKTNELITDFSVPAQDAGARLGGYPVGVIHNGMLLAGEVTGDKRFIAYTSEALQLIADRLPYFKAQAEKYGSSGNSLRDFFAPSSLDSCGAWGAAMVKARRAGLTPNVKPTIDLFAEFVSHKQFRLKDSTLARKSPQPNSLWADDMYMSIPFLAQMGTLTGESHYYDDAARQALQISKRLFNEQKGIYSHGWSQGNADNNPEFYWGRANGWCLMATVELLDVLPENHRQRPALLKLLRTQIKALTGLQSSSGMWHQLLDKPDSYLETSCSAMFTFGIARAVNRGWVSAASYGPVALSGWNGVAHHIKEDGRIDGTCVGTNYASDAAYYYRRPSRDDFHGYGPALLAGAEVIQLLKNDHLRIRNSPGNPISVTERKPN
jgi:unsaturated rhamnogalacturonyl hydrolase